MDFNIINFILFLFLLIFVLFVFGFILYFSTTIILNLSFHKNDKELDINKIDECNYNFILKILTSKKKYQQFVYQDFYKIFIKQFPDEKSLEKFVLFLSKNNVYEISSKQKESTDKLNTSLKAIVDYYESKNSSSITKYLLSDIFFRTETIANHGDLSIVKSLFKNEESFIFITKFYGNNPTDNEIVTDDEIKKAA